ncbi:MAG: Mo-dependent nitrogenase C-terminal domain-containing protein [Snowella sp.]|nr:Mo-dependent nitrogenase C-terminal domain-containing protein [Snowella sp.]
MSVNTYTIRHLILGNQFTENSGQKPNPLNKSLFPDFLFPVKAWLNHLEINNPQLAHRLCQLIPAQCPFARKITFAGQILFSIPPLCKINPLYEELMMLRFRALSYLADECGEDISQYC